MAPKGGEKAKKAARREQEKKKDKVVEDKTFGLKNKNKSKVVQKFVQNVQKNVKGSDAQKDQLRQEKKQLKMMRIQQEQELKALFSEALSINVKKSDLRKKKGNEQTANTNANANTSKGGGDHYDEAWAEAELAKAGTSGEEKTLEQLIEEQRENMRKEGKVGTPVTKESFAKWKADKAERQRREQEAALKAEQLKKKGGKGLSLLSGKQLFAHDSTLFVDDDDAHDSAAYANRRDHNDEEEENENVPAVAQPHNESLYLEDDDLDELLLDDD